MYLYRKPPPSMRCPAGCMPGFPTRRPPTQGRCSLQRPPLRFGSARPSVLSRRVGCHLTVTLVVKIGEKSRTKGEYRREVDSQLSSQLSDSPRKTPAPANRDIVTRKAVNRRVAS